MAVTAEPEAPHIDSDLQAAWRLAFVVVADREVATKAVARALAQVGAGQAPAQPVRTDLFATTLGLSLTRAAENPEMEADSAVTTALWQLPAQQRAALWLTKVTELDHDALAMVLGVSPVNAGHVADRAAEWLDIALDHESGPLCRHEANLADFIEGRLPVAKARAIDDHLSGCPTCQTKVRAFEALADLKAVLSRAVPEAPDDLSAQARQQQEASPGSGGAASMDDSRRRPPAVRALAACCAGLLILALFGVTVVRPARHSTTPGTSVNAGAAAPDGSTVGAGTSVPGSQATDVSGSTVPIVTVTTTTLQPVTFPTAGPGGARRR